MLLVAGAFAAPLTFSAADGSIGWSCVASLHDFTGRARAWSGELDPDNGLGLLSIAVAGLSTQLGPRDSRMQQYAFDVQNFPALTFAVRRVTGSLDALRARAGGGTLDLEGTLTMRDVSRPLTVGATFAWEGDALRLRGELPLSWRDWNVPDPSVVLSTLDPGVTVNFDVLGRPS